MVGGGGDGGQRSAAPRGCACRPRHCRSSAAWRIPWRRWRRRARAGGAGDGGGALVAVDGSGVASLEWTSMSADDYRAPTRRPPGRSGSKACWAGLRTTRRCYQFEKLWQAFEAELGPRNGRAVAADCVRLLSSRGGAAGETLSGRDACAGSRHLRRLRIPVAFMCRAVSSGPDADSRRGRRVAPAAWGPVEHGGD